MRVWLARRDRPAGVGGALAQLDETGVRALRALPHGRRLDAALSRSSALAEHAGAWLALGAVGVAVDRARRRRWLRAVAAVAATEVAAQAVKRIVRRPRPALPGLPALAATPSAYSFPSAHTAAAVAAARAYPGLLPAAALRTAVGATALSRAYLGVHYPSDILAGAALGAAMGALGPAPRPSPSATSSDEGRSRRRVIAGHHGRAGGARSSPPKTGGRPSADQPRPFMPGALAGARGAGASKIRS